MADNFQSMAGAGGNPMMLQQQPSQGQIMSITQVQQFILNLLQQQPPHPSGWQTNMTVQERMGQVWHIFTQLRLASGERSDLQKLGMLAITFEKTCFDQSLNKEIYGQMLGDKLSKLTNARSQHGMTTHQQMQMQQAQRTANMNMQAQIQAMAMNNVGMQNQMAARGMMPQQSQQQVQQQSQQPFHHLQHQMTASQIPGQSMPQQQGQIGMMNTGLPPNMMQSQQQQQFQLAMAAQHQAQHQQQQMAQNRPRPIPLSEQEMAMANNAAAQSVAKLSEEQRNDVRNKVKASLDRNLLAQYQSTNTDLAFVYYRNNHVNRLRGEKLRAMAAHQNANSQQPQNGQVNMGLPQTAPLMQPQMSANSNQLMPQTQQQLGNLGPDSDFKEFLSGVENLMTQQKSVPLVQDASQLMGPGGTQVNGTPQGIAPPGTQQQNMQHPSNPNQMNQQQQQLFNNPQAQQDRLNAMQTQVQQDRMNAMQSQAQLRRNAQMKAQQQMALNGQPGGMGPIAQQQSPAMNTLNTPLRTPQQQGNSMDPMAQISQPAQQFSQPMDPRIAQMNQQRANQAAAMNGLAMNGLNLPTGMSQEQKQKLLTMPKEKLNEVLRNMNAQQQQEQPNRAQLQMTGNGQGIPRPTQPGQARPPGAFNHQNMAAQFMPGGPNGQAMASMTPQQQQIFRQQMGMRNMPLQQQMTNPGMDQNSMPPDQTVVSQLLDGQDFPPNLRQKEMFQQLPQDIKKWSQLKQWISMNPALAQSNAQEQVKVFQRMQYQQVMRNRALQTQQAQQRQQAAAAAALNGQVPNQQQANLVMPPGMAPVAPMGQQGPVGNLPFITAGDIAKARNHPSGKYANLSDDTIAQFLLKNFQQQQRMRNQMQMNPGQQQVPMQTGQLSAMNQTQNQLQPGMQRPNMPPQQVPMPTAPGPKQAVKPQAPVSVPANQQPQPDPILPPSSVTKTTKATQASRVTQTSSPAPPAKSLKRTSSSDDVVEVSNPNASKLQQPASQKPQAYQRQFVHLTQQQLSRLNPEQKKIYDAHLARVTLAATARCKEITEEFQKGNLAGPVPPIKMSKKELEEMRTVLSNTGPRLRKVSFALPKWFMYMKDENRLRDFLRAYHRVSQQFLDENMEKPKSEFSIRPADVTGTYALANSMMADVQHYLPMMKSQSNGGTAPASGAPSNQPGKQTTPLNAANLHQQQAALKQQQLKTHNRQASRSTPAAPTSAQPPFSIDSALAGDAFPKTLTQEQLRLPPTKKQRQSSNANSATAQQSLVPMSAADKASSPGGKGTAQQQPRQVEKRKFLCPEPDCEHHLDDGFESQDALELHQHEEHVVPLENPPLFVIDQLSTMLGLKSDGTPKEQPATDATGLQKMASSLSQPGQGSNVKLEKVSSSAGTPLNRQASTSGVKPSPAGLKDAKTPQQVKKDHEAAVSKATEVEHPWQVNSVDPRALQATFSHMETGAGGAIADMATWCAITDNDTPESSNSKDSGVSELNSDISEGADLNLNLNFDMDFDQDWMAFGPGVELNLANMNMDPNDDLTEILMGNTENVAGNGMNFDASNDFDFDMTSFNKPFSSDMHDMSMYEFNIEQGGEMTG